MSSYSDLNRKKQKIRLRYSFVGYPHTIGVYLNEK